MSHPASSPKKTPSPEPDPSTEEHAEREGDTPPTKRKGTVHMKSPKSLERLRDRVGEAAREILRLRKENAALAQRLEELEAQQAALPPGGTMLTFEKDPEILRKQVEHFIQTIDQYLDQEKENNP
jgi:hypothetical protein